MRLFLSLIAGAILGAYCARSEYACMAWRMATEPPITRSRAHVDSEAAHRII